MTSSKKKFIDYQSEIIADEVDKWALDEKREHPDFRIAVCGYEHNFNTAEYEKRDWYLHK